MAKTKIAVVGSCNMDIYSWTDHLPEPGETVIGDRYWMVMGGKGANQAVAACLQGAEVSMISRVGDDLFGTRMLETLASYGVDSTYVRVDPGAGSGVALVVVDKQAENVIVVIPGTNMCITPEDVDAAADRIRAADIVLAQLEIPLPAITRAFDIAHQGNTRCILNPAPARPLPEELYAKIDLITPNQNEAKVLTGIPADSLEGAEAAGRALLARGVPVAVITLGQQGALLVTPEGTQHLEGQHMPDSLDTTGAGDAFLGGLAVSAARGRALPDAIRFANVVAALSTRRRGAMPSMPGQEEVRAYLSGHHLQDLMLQPGETK